jgi:hypothetical protein
MGYSMTTAAKRPGITPFRAWERSWIDAEAASVESGGSPAHLPHGLLRWLDGGSFLPPRVLLGELEPYLPGLYRESDSRLALADCFLGLWNRLHPFAPIRRVHARASDGWHDLWLEVGIAEPGSPLDLPWLLLPLFRAFPRAFALPEFEVVQAVADPRRVDAILADDPGVRFAHGGLDVGGMRLGESVPVRDHFREAGIPAPEGWEMDADACQVRADYYCPRRRRILLQAGCVYGAPGLVFHAGFRALDGRDANPLAPLIRAVVEGGRDSDGQAGPEAAAALTGSAALLREDAPAYRAPHRFVYHQADDSISCDGRHLTKNVPARILRRLVRDYVQSGRREFEFRTFKRDAEIVTNRKRPNFEVRLRRVQEVVSGVPCGLILHRPRPGLLELEASGPIEYAEES